MKTRVWTVSPVLYVAALLMMGMTALSWFYAPRYLFWTEAGVTAAVVLAAIIVTVQFRFHVKNALIGAGHATSGKELSNLNEFQLPVVIVGDKEDILWCNTAFHNKLEDSESPIGRHVSVLLGNLTMNQVVENGGDISVGNREFSVFGRWTADGGVLYFVEDTYYKEMEREYAISRPVLCLIAYDNREEIARDSNSGEETRILGQLESTLNEWSYNQGGIFKKLSGGTRYLVVMNVGSYRLEKEHNFPILEKIRSIKTAEGLSATVSIGVGKGAASFAEAEKWARQSLDMALGRGGDQVAIKQEGDSYEFFGGLSKGVEKRDKSRTRVIASTISSLIRQSDVVLCMGHKYSDLDSVGSAVGMCATARRGFDKPAYVVLDKEQTLSRSLIDMLDDHLKPGEKPLFITPEEALEVITPRTLLIISDTHSQDYVESRRVLEKAQKVVVIDHHRLVVHHIENAAVFFHEPYASSASEMVAELVQFMGSTAINKVEAEALLSGIMLDTKGFVMRCGVRTFEAAAYLRRRGADTVETKRMFSGSITDYKAKFQLVSNAEIYGSCAITCSSAKLVPNIRIVASQAADELLAIQDVLASFVLFEGGGAVNVSARSLGDVNVQILMEELGGGGHLTMAGAQLTGVSMEQAKMMLLKVLQDTLPRATKFKK